MKFIYEMQLFLLNLQNFMFEVTTENAHTFHSFIRDSRHIVAVTHMHPDGDAIGCCMALRSFLLECYGKEADVILPDPVPSPMSFLTDGCPVCDGASEANLRTILDADLIVALDINSFKRTGALEEPLRESKATKVLIDHHPDPGTDEFDLIFSRTDISSACEHLYQVLMRMPCTGSDAKKLPGECAMALMAGMTTDTNNFANSVFPSTFNIASELIAAGVDRDGLIQSIYNSGREEKVRGWSHLLDRNLTLMDCGVAYMVLDRETRDSLGLLEGETDGLVNIPLQIGRILVSALITEEDGFFRISLRSKKCLSINTLARESFHGGGHPQASGGRIFIPDDLTDRSGIAAYFEHKAARFMQDWKAAGTNV